MILRWPNGQNSQQAHARIIYVDILRRAIWLRLTTCFFTYILRIHIARVLTTTLVFLDTCLSRSIYVATRTNTLRYD